MFGMGPMELVIVGVVAVLLFGSRLPEVARSMGSSYRQFREGLTDLQSQVQYEVNSAPAKSTPRALSDDDDEDDAYAEAAAPKFEPPPAESSESNA